MALSPEKLHSGLNGSSDMRIGTSVGLWDAVGGPSDTVSAEGGGGDEVMPGVAASSFTVYWDSSDKKYKMYNPLVISGSSEVEVSGADNLSTGDYYCRIDRTEEGEVTAEVQTGDAKEPNTVLVVHIAEITNDRVDQHHVGAIYVPKFGVKAGIEEDGTYDWKESDGHKLVTGNVGLAVSKKLLDRLNATVELAEYDEDTGDGVFLLKEDSSSSSGITVITELTSVEVTSENKIRVKVKKKRLKSVIVDSTSESESFSVADVVKKTVVVRSQYEEGVFRNYKMELPFFTGGDSTSTSDQVFEAVAHSEEE